MKQVLFFLAMAAVLFSCASEPTQITLVDENRDAVAHLSPDPDILGNTELFFIPVTIQGSSIWIINGPGANVGIDIRDSANSAFIYYADSFISRGSNSAQTGTQIPWNRWMRIRLAVYDSGLSGLIVSVIDGMGLDFFSNIEDYMVERIYETEIYLSGNGTRYCRPVIECRLQDTRNCEEQPGK